MGMSWGRHKSSGDAGVRRPSHIRRGAVLAVAISLLASLVLLKLNGGQNTLRQLAKVDWRMFALGLALQAGIVMLFSDTPRPFPAPEWLSGQMELGPFRISVASDVTIVIAVLVLCVLGLVLNRTRIGIAIRWDAEDPEGA